MSYKKQVSLDELSSKFWDDGSSLNSAPIELTAGQKLTRNMSLVLLSIVVMLIVISVIL